MDDLPTLPVRSPPSVQAALVAVLHSPRGTRLAHDLVRAWGPMVPAAVMATILVDSADGIAEPRAQIGCNLRQSGVDVSSLVLAGVGGGEQAALQLAFGQAAVPCVGVVACGDSLSPLCVLGGQPEASRAKLRLVWTAGDPLFCSAVLGDLLRCLRTAGLDAQGAVLQGRDRQPTEVHGNLPPPLVHLAGAYVAELVAIALSSKSRPRAHFAGAG